MLQILQGITDKTLLHACCNLVIEIGGVLFEKNEVIWQDLLDLVFQFVNGDDNSKIDAALQIFNGLFSYMMDHFLQYKSDLFNIF